MILTGHAIQQAWKGQELTIEPFDASQLNPNSYNYRLGDALVEVTSSLNDARETNEIQLPVDGYELRPGRLYLGCTYERIGSDTYVTTLLGRSSVGRLGLFLNVSADLGHCGAVSRWTLELKVVQPLRVYPRMLIGQVCFWTQRGIQGRYDGRYQSDLMPRVNLDERLYTAQAHR